MGEISTLKQSLEWTSGRSNNGVGGSSMNSHKKIKINDLKIASTIMEPENL
jgi:hypothetical protein